MEKYSAFRDPGTGIQPFLTPVPPQGSETLRKVLLPLGIIVGAVRTGLVVCLAVVYLIVVKGICTVFLPVPILHRILGHAITALLARATLLVLGVYWISVDNVARQRSRSGQHRSHWQVRAGDIIVSNWVSWIEVLWLAFRYDPTFVLPVTTPLEKEVVASPVRSIRSRHAGHSPGATAVLGRTASKRTEVVGFREVSLLKMVRITGQVPPYNALISEGEGPKSLSKIRNETRRPIVIFPECTTSNGRGILRFADCFKDEPVPTKGYSVFIMCVRIDPPTQYFPTLSLSIPAKLNPLPHIFSLASSLIPPSLSIRLLAPSESPSSGSFMASEIVSKNMATTDILSESCASLISSIGRIKRTGMGWEDKVAFFDFYNGKSR